jgi:amino-acid N-acetyltransferase
MATSPIYEPLNSPVHVFPTRETSEVHPHSEVETSRSYTAPSHKVFPAQPVTRVQRGNAPLQTRQAQLRDAKAIHLLIHSYTHDGTLLPRSYSEICQNIHTFTVAETEDGEFLGCASLHIYGRHLAEIRSVVVRPVAAGRGAGRLLVQSLLQQAQQDGIRCICLFTRIPAFFERFRFCATEHRLLRDKIWKDCQHCSRRKGCDEVAMTVGELPPLDTMADPGFIPHPPQGDLVQVDL